jgi:hypothetical protein
VRRETQINFTTYQCIRLGDTEDEIEQLIGLPSGSYSGLLTHWGTAWPLLPLDNFSRNGVLHENGIITKGWASKDGVIVIDFDGEGKAIWKAFYEMKKRSDLSLFESIASLATGNEHYDVGGIKDHTLRHK